MNINIDSPLLWRICAIIAISMLITCSGGCKFGKKVNSGSSGVVRVIGPSDLIQQPNGTYKLKPQSSTLKPIDLKPVRSRPEEPKLESAKPTPVTPQVKTPKFEPTKFEPTKIPPTRINTRPSTIEESPIEVNVNIKPNPPETPNKGGEGTPPGGNEKPSVKIDWVSLLFFYFLASLFALGVWGLYDWYKSKNPKK
jgi:hypothetical protein